MAKAVALIFGIVYTLIGVLGFFPAIGGSITLAPGLLLGIASINLPHNIVHLVIGLVGLFASSDERNAATYCKWAGIILIALAIIGFITDNLLGYVPLGGNDRWLHLISGLVLTFAGFRSPASARAKTSS